MQPQSSATQTRTNRRPLAALANLFSYPRPARDYAGVLSKQWSQPGGGARVVSVIRETDNAASIILRPPAGFPLHRPGQYLQVGIFIDGRLHSRCYSLTSVPGQAAGLLNICVKAIPGGLVSGHLVHALQRGDEVRIAQPQGDFVQAPEDTSAPTLFITAGSGITPVMSMLRTAAARDALGDVVHLHYARSPEEMIFGAELGALRSQHPGYRLIPVYTRSATSASTTPQHFHAGQLDILCPDWRQRTTWACGPAPLLDALQAHWQLSGRAQQLHTERFTTRIAPIQPTDTGGRVRFAQSARETDAAPGKPLLQLAEELGLNPPSGCRMGICHSCDCTMKSGAVRDLRSGALIRGENIRIQPCISSAAGNLELEL